MTPKQWDRVKHFDPTENWGDPSRMDHHLIAELDRLRAWLHRPIVIHCGYEPRDGKGQHPLGKAVDCHAEGLHPMEFCIAASRFDFGGIGVYLWWDHPGLHLDTRSRGKRKMRALWGSVKAGPDGYVPFDLAFWKKAADLKIKGGL
jgi:uncharacterized protein YcbK (DUF882 family)